MQLTDEQLEETLSAQTNERCRFVCREAFHELKQWRASDLASVIEQNQKLQAALMYARDRRGSSFDFDEWKTQVEHALDNKIPPHALENAQAKEAQAWQAVKRIREERDALKAELRELEAKQAAFAEAAR